MSLFFFILAGVVLLAAILPGGGNPISGGIKAGIIVMNIAFFIIILSYSP